MGYKYCTYSISLSRLLCLPCCVPRLSRIHVLTTLSLLQAAVPASYVPHLSRIYVDAVFLLQDAVPDVPHLSLIYILNTVSLLQTAVPASYVPHLSRIHVLTTVSLLQAAVPENYVPPPV